MKSNCGFDEQFLNLFKKKISLLNEKEKHEIFPRESINVNLKTLTYSRIEDFRKDESSLNSGEKADHGLVMMFQSLRSNITQPIVVFCSKVPVKVINLKQI